MITRWEIVMPYPSRRPPQQLDLFPLADLITLFGHNGEMGTRPHRTIIATAADKIASTNRASIGSRENQRR